MIFRRKINIKYLINLAIKELGGKCVILIYHRVSDINLDPQLLSVSLANFEGQMAKLAQKYSVLSMNELLNSFVRGRVPRHAVVVTFDDGFADNLWNAQPVLEHYRIPATIFVSSNYIGSKREMPSDILERTVLSAKNLPKELIIDINGKIYSWLVGGNHPVPSDWNVLKEAIGPRTTCYKALHTLLRSMSPILREKILDQLIAQIPESRTDRLIKRCLNYEELRILDQGGLINIGSHSKSHVLLEAQDPLIQFDEIVGSKSKIENILGHSVDTFAFPYHGPRNLSDNQLIDVVRNAGYKLAFDNRNGSVFPRKNNFLLPRILIRNLPAADFASYINKFI